MEKDFAAATIVSDDTKARGGLKGATKGHDKWMVNREAHDITFSPRMINLMTHDEIQLLEHLYSSLYIRIYRDVKSTRILMPAVPGPEKKSSDSVDITSFCPMKMRCQTP